MGDSYVGKSNLPELMEALYKLAPLCPICMGRKLHFCIERCCSGSDLLCLSCESQNPQNPHLAHRKNQLRLLFIDKDIIRSESDWFLKHGPQMRNFLQQKKKLLENTISSLQKAIGEYEEIIKKVEIEIERVKKTDWHRVMYEIVENAIINRKTNPENCYIFNSKVKQMNLYDDNLGKLFGKLYILTNNFQKRRFQINFALNVDQFISQSKLNMQVTKVEKLIGNTNIEKFFNLKSKPQSHSYSLNAPYLNNNIFQKIAPLLNYFNRSIVSMNHSAPLSEILASRVLELENCYNKLNLRERMQELHTYISYEKLPKYLLALSYYGLGSQSTFVPPQKLVRLRISYSSIESCLKNISELKNLQYFVVTVFNGVVPQFTTTRKILKLAINKNLRMLCIVQERQHVNVLLRLSRTQAVFTHRFQTLRRHYYLYRRRIILFTLLSRCKPHIKSVLYRVLQDILWQQQEQ